MCAITFLPGSIQKLGSTSSMNVAMSPSGSLTLDLALGTFVAFFFWWYSNWKKSSLSLIPLLTKVNYYASFISASLLFLSFTLSDILFLRCQTLFFQYHFPLYLSFWRVYLYIDTNGTIFSFLFSSPLSFAFHVPPCLLYSAALPYSTPLYSALLFSTPLCSTLLNSTLHHFSSLYSALLCSTLLFFALLYCQAVDTPEVVS